jgi:hypothetical protein
MIINEDCGAIGGMLGMENLHIQWKPEALSTTDPTRPHPGSKPGRRGGKPAPNRLSYGTAQSLPS